MKLRLDGSKSMLGLFVVFAFASGCTGGGSEGDDGDDSTGDSGGIKDCNPDNRIEWDGMTVAEADPSPDSTLDCDPHVAVIAFYEGDSVVGDQLEGIAVSATWGMNAANTFNVVAIKVGVLGQPFAADTPYPLTGGDNALFDTIDPDGAGGVRLCQSSAGEVTLSQLGAMGEPVMGSYSVTAWDDSSGTTCPTLPATGTFEIVRDN